MPSLSTSTTPAPQSGVTTPEPQTSEKKLANTGYSALIAGAFTILLVLFSAGVYSVSRKDN